MSVMIGGGGYIGVKCRIRTGFIKGNRSNRVEIY